MITNSSRVLFFGTVAALTLSQSVLASQAPGTGQAMTNAETHGALNTLRVRVLGDAATTACNYLGAPLPQKGNYLQTIGNMTCFTTRTGRPGFGFVLDASQSLHDLVSLGAGLPASPVFVDSAAVGVEFHGFYDYTRVVLKGAPAAQLCAFYGIQLKDKPAGYTENWAAVTCTKNLENEMEAGFLFNMYQELYPLNAFNR